MNRHFNVLPEVEFSEQVGRYVAMLEDVRRRVKQYVNGLTPEQLSWTPNPRVESIGTVLLHIAAVEVSWIQEDICRKPMSEAEWGIAFPIRLGISQVSGEPLAYYLEKLDRTRAETREILRGLTDADLQRVVSPLEPGDPNAPPTTYTIEWILYHLVEHEAHHKGQIAVMKRLLPF